MLRFYALLPTALLFAFLSVSTELKAQDKVFFDRRDTLSVQVIEKHEDRIVYKRTGDPQDVIHSMSTKRIAKIEFQDGRVDSLRNKNPRHYRPFSVQAGANVFTDLMGDHIGLDLSYFLIPQIALQISLSEGGGDGPHWALGALFHLNNTYSTQALTPFVGIMQGYDEDNNRFVRIPLGLRYTGKKGFTASLGWNELFYRSELRRFNRSFMEARIGYQFQRQKLGL